MTLNHSILPGKKLALPGIFLLSILATAEQSHFFISPDSLIAFFIEHEITPSADQLSIDTINLFDTNIQIIVPKDNTVSMLDNSWPVLFHWGNDTGIVIQKFMQTTPTSRVVWGGINIVTVKKIFDSCEQGEVFAVEVRDSVVEISDEEIGILTCVAENLLYLFLLEKNQKSIALLTPTPMVLGTKKKCNLKNTNELLWNYENDTLMISGNPATLEQKQWIGKYITRADRLIRSENQTDFLKRMLTAHEKSLEHFNKKELELAISVLKPIINHAPETALDNKTLDIFNDYVFFLEQKTAYNEALSVLQPIIDKFPKSTITNLNIADVYFALGDQSKAKEYYKTYKELMESSNRKNKIPPRVLKRI